MVTPSETSIWYDSHGAAERTVGVEEEGLDDDEDIRDLEALLAPGGGDRVHDHLQHPHHSIGSGTFVIVQRQEGRRLVRSRSSEW